MKEEMKDLPWEDPKRAIGEVQRLEQTFEERGVFDRKRVGDL
jgi:hypothetical protein